LSRCWDGVCINSWDSGGAGARATDVLLCVGAAAMLEWLFSPKPTLEKLSHKVCEADIRLEDLSRKDRRESYKAIKANASRVFLRPHLLTPEGERAQVPPKL
jgi:hypothetical protein